MDARYQDPDIGRFISIDPVYLSVGTSDLKQKTGLEPHQYLADPQGLNSYAYARNNPLRLVDEDGDWFKEFATGEQSWSSFHLELGQVANQLTQDSGVWNGATSNPIAGGVQIDYLKDNKVLFSEVGLFGEIVNYKASYFIEDKKVYYFHEEITRYEKSIYSKDFDPESGSVEIRDFYLDENQNLCAWFVNQKSKGIDKTIENYVNETIAGLNLEQSLKKTKSLSNFFKF